jgi:DUF4097 and DUF4098 domain-containing protein YvlB
MSEFPAAGPILATVRISTGTLRVIAERRDTVDVEVQPGAGGEAARNAAAETLVEMAGDQLTVETPQARGFVIRRNAPVNITVRVPTDSRLMLRSASADIVCDGRFGDADISTASGDLMIDHVAGDLQRHAASGDMRFNRIDGRLASDAASGDMRGRSIGGDLAAKTASGDIQVEAVAGGVRVTTASGDISFGSLATGTTRIQSASGDVVLGIAEGTPLWLDLSTVSGDTRTDLPVSSEPPAGTAATLSLYVRTVSGDITLRRAVTPPAEPSPRTNGAAMAVDSEPQD